jgi:multidrug efflux pump subunit AcrB
MKSFLRGLYSNTVLANILLVLIVFTGIAAALSMVREEMPNVTFDRVRISVAYPGADPVEVEEAISRKIEESVKGMAGIKSLTTIAYENMGVTSIEIKDGYDGQEMLDRVRSRINEISTFPEDAESPVITLPLHSDAVMGLYLSGDVTEKAMKEWAYQIKDELLQLDEISQVEISGIRDYEINVELSEEKLREYGVTLSQVTNAIRQSSLNRSAGVIRNGTNEIRVRTVGRKYSGEEFSSIVVLAMPEGELITLDKLADIRDGFVEDRVDAKVNGSPAVIINIFKTSEEDTIHMSDAVNDYISEKQSGLTPGTELGIVFDNSGTIRHQINMLVKNGLLGLGLVFVILWLFLSARLSLWAGIGILTSLCGGLALTWICGGTLNMISVFAFIMILGIVADDAIVVGEAIAWHRQAGAGPLDSAIRGFSEVGKPVTAGVLTTVIAFTPLLFLSGMMGKMIAILPVVVIACLGVSLFESFVLLPAHLAHLPDSTRPGKTVPFFLRWITIIPEKMSWLMDTFSEKIYRPFLQKALNWRYIFLSLTITVLMLSLGTIQGGFVEFEMLSQRDGYFLTGLVEFPEGTSLAVTDDAVKKMEAAFIRVADRLETKSGEPMIENLLTLSGQAPAQEPGDEGEQGAHLGGVQVMLLDSLSRGIHTDDLIQEWKKELGAVYGAKTLSFNGAVMGPPDKPITIAIDGDNVNDMLAAADSLKKRLERFEGVFDVQVENIQGKNEIRFQLKPEARALGITLKDLADQVYAGYFGEEALRVQRGIDEISIRVRYPQSERMHLSSLKQIRIRTAQGDEVPLGVVATLEYGPGMSTIIRAEGKRRIKIGADVDTGTIHSDDVLDVLNAGFLKELETTYPGIQVVLKGEAEHTASTFSDLYVAIVVVILGIYMLIAALFRSYLQPLVVLFTLPFGLIGAIWGHLLLGWTLTLFSLFGMVGLTGIVVNDAIVLIERINGNLKQGMGFTDAILQGGVRRFRAVFLTSISTVGGLAPMIFESDPYAEMMIPVAITIVFGVIFATVLTLVLIPCLLMILNDLRLLAAFIKGGTWKSRAEVEPAISRHTENPDASQTPGLQLISGN